MRKKFFGGGFWTVLDMTGCQVCSEAALLQLRMFRV